MSDLGEKEIWKVSLISTIQHNKLVNHKVI
jgi:hypothetical protein